MAISVQAETLKTIFNSAFGGPDFYTALSSSTLPSGSTNYIQNRTTLQTGSTFYVSSGSVSGQFSPTTIKWPDGTIQVSSPTAGSSSSGGGVVSPGTFTWTNSFGVNVSTIVASTSSILMNGSGGDGGIYQFAVGSGNGTTGFNSYGGGYVAGVNGLGGLWQFTLADGKLIYYNESSVSAGNSHGHTVALTIDGSHNMGIGTSNPSAGFHVIGPTANAYTTIFSTSSSGYQVALSTSGHLLSSGGTPTISACGTTPNGSVVGNDISGVITVGGGVVTSCTLRFNAAYETNAPSCVVNDTANILFTETQTTTSTMVARATATFGGDTLSYFCIGRQ